MPILSSIAGIAAKAYGMMANAKRIITDTFNRANGSLGTTSSGHLWSVLRGTWSISSNQATSSDSGSSYPLATVDIGAQNVIVSADITDGGPGLAFWVTDANSWWASSVNYNRSYVPHGYYANSVSAAYYDRSISFIGNVYHCENCPYCYYHVFSGQCLDSEDNTPCFGCTLVFSHVFYHCNGPGGNAYSGGGNCGTYIPGGNCDLPTAGGVGGDCNFVDLSYYVYNTSLKLYKNISGTITNADTSTLNSNTSGYQRANSIKITTSGESISAQAFSSAGLSSQLGPTLTHNATGAIRGAKTGIIKTPSDDNAGLSIDNFATENTL